MTSLFTDTLFVLFDMKTLKVFPFQKTSNTHPGIFFESYIFGIATFRKSLR